MRNSIALKASMVALLLSGVVVSGHAATVVINDALAGRVGHTATDTPGIGTSVNTTTTLDAGVFANGFQVHPVFVFQMTGVTVPAEITTANFSVSLISKLGTFTFSANANVIRKGASPTILASDYQDSLVSLMTSFSENTDATGLVDGLVSLNTAGQETLGMWLKNNWVENEYVFIGLQTNPLTTFTPVTGNTTRMYRYGGTNNVEWSEDSTNAQLTVIPEPAMPSLVGLAGVALLFIRRRLTI